MTRAERIRSEERKEAFYACSFLEFGLIVGIVSAVKFSSGFKVPFVAFRSKDQFFSFFHCIDVVFIAFVHTHTFVRLPIFHFFFLLLRKPPLYCHTTKVKIKMKLQLKCCTFTELMAQQNPIVGSQEQRWAAFCWQFAHSCTADTDIHDNRILGIFM